MSKRNTRRIRFENIFASASTPVFVVDRDLQVVWVNSALQELGGWTDQELVGRICFFGSHSEHENVEAMTGAMCPPPETLAGHPKLVAKTFAHKETGGSTTLPIHFIPLEDRGEEVSHVIGIAGEMTQPAVGMDLSLVSEVHAELAALRHSIRERFSIHSVITKSPAMQRSLRQAHAASKISASVFLQGPAGVGKEHLARAIHYESELKAKAFVPIECRLLSANELSRTIRHLTETDWDEALAINALHPGCVMLKDVESLPRDIQHRLTEFLVGGNGEQFLLNARLVVSSRRSATDLIDRELLTEDFLYLATSIEIQIPALASRRSDIPILAQHFVEERNSLDKQKQVSGVANDVLDLFQEYNWPGNVGELKAVIEEAHASTEDSVIRQSSLPFRFRTGLDAQQVGPQTHFEPLEITLARVEREQIDAAMKAANNNKAKAAALLGLTRASLYRKLEK